MGEGDLLFFGKAGELEMLYEPLVINPRLNTYAHGPIVGAKRPVDQASQPGLDPPACPVLADKDM